MRQRKSYLFDFLRTGTIRLRKLSSSFGIPTINIAIKQLGILCIPVITQSSKTAFSWLFFFVTQLPPLWSSPMSRGTLQTYNQRTRWTNRVMTVFLRFTQIIILNGNRTHDTFLNERRECDYLNHTCSNFYS